MRAEVEQPAQGFDLDEAVALIERTPRVLRAWLSGLPAGWLRADEGAATYSPLEIVGHLVHGEETDWIPRTRRMLEHGERVPFDRYDRFAQRRLHAGDTLEDLLALFERRRAESVAALRALLAGAAPAGSPAGLDVRGMHPVLGAVTLRQLLATWVVHDLSHLRQAARAMAQRYRGEVGAWAEFMPVLQEGPLARAPGGTTAQAPRA
ncbi:MAG: DinB family protein [Planctomycetes bacterium]|nr:DinB family protein [Planctomycetota bacterium]